MVRTLRLAVALVWLAVAGLAVASAVSTVDAAAALRLAGYP